jgi:hypothetical protein
MNCFISQPFFRFYGFASLNYNTINLKILLVVGHKVGNKNFGSTDQNFNQHKLFYSAKMLYRQGGLGWARVANFAKLLIILRNKKK